MSNDYAPAIAALERRLEEAERKVNALRGAINILCIEAGLPPSHPDGGGGGPQGTKIGQIKDDTFYGKKQQTAIREYLEMRKSQGLGPAKPREIYDALKQGGYQFESKDDTIALVGLRALLRKRTNIFHKLPTGGYGLTAWYSDLKSPKNRAMDAEDDLEEEGTDTVDDNSEAPTSKTSAA